MTSSPSKIIVPITLVAAAVLGGCNGPSKQGIEDRQSAMSRVDLQQSQISYEQALRAYRTGQFDRAMRNLEDALSRASDQTDYYILLAKICLETGRMEGASNALDVALDLDGELAEAHYLRGVLYQRWSRDEESLDSYLQAWNSDPSGLQSLQYLLAAGEVLVDMGEYERARDLLMPKLGYYENSAAMHHLLGTVHTLLEDHKTAVRHHEQAALIGGGEDAIMADLARAQLRAGLHRECLRTIDWMAKNAEADTEPGVDVEPEPWILRLKGTCLREMGATRESALVYAQLVRWAPEDADAWVELGSLAHELGDMKRVRSSGERLTTLAPARFEGYLYRGLAMYEEGNLGESARWLERAVAVAPAEQTSPRLFLASVQAELGDVNGALATVNEVLEIDPAERRAMRLRGMLTATAGVDTIAD